MNTIDIHDGLQRNREFEARYQAKLDAIYEEERRKYGLSNNDSYNNSVTVNISYDNDDDYDDNDDYDERLSNIENKLDSIEMIVKELKNNIISLENSNNLFVFTPNNNNSNLGIQLNEDQFRAIIDKMFK